MITNTNDITKTMSELSNLLDGQVETCENGEVEIIALPDMFQVNIIGTSTTFETIDEYECAMYLQFICNLIRG